MSTVDVEARIVARIARLRKLREDAADLDVKVDSDAIDNELELLEKLMHEE